VIRKKLLSPEVGRDSGKDASSIQVQMNYFEYRSVAERYARHRPYFHPLVIEKVKTYLKIERPVPLALDVGCGPGQSTVALKEIADVAIGMDISAGMLGVADQRADIQYIQSPAERLPLRNTSADLITTSLAFHWFDPERFFDEARRVLKAQAWLVISNNGFAGQMRENPGIEQWFQQVYDRRYPSPPRNVTPMSSPLAQVHGFHFAQEEYQNQVQFSVEELAAYLVTQSNVIAVTEHGNERVEDIFEWIVGQTRPLFKSERSSFLFSGYIWYMQKMN
jgi:ubiquinone/menaquinone biosynthesis C-methylase UbiE